MPNLGQFANGPIQFDEDTGAIEARGSTPSTPSATSSPAAPTARTSSPDTPAPMPEGSLGGGGGVLPDAASPVAPPSPAAGAQEEDSDGGSTFNGNMGRDAFNFQHPFDSLNTQPFGHIGGTIGRIGFEDGGAVEDTPQPEQETSPMDVLRQALKFGRKKMGLPTDFTNGTSEQDADQSAISFDDGGVVPEPGQNDDVTATATSQGGTPNPQNTLKYLTGDGAVSPEIAQAFERHVDPQGTMHPADRVMATLGAAPDDEAKFGMAQHYRTKFNAYAGAAHAALDKGNDNLAAKHASDAMANTGKNVSFVPAGNGNFAALVNNAAAGMRRLGGAGLLGRAPIAAGDEAFDKYHGSGGVLSMDDGGEVPDSTEQVLADHEAEGAEQDAQPQPQQVMVTRDQMKALVTGGFDKAVDGGTDQILSDHAAQGAEQDAQPAPQAPNLASVNTGGAAQAASGGPAPAPVEQPQGPAAVVAGGGMGAPAPTGRDKTDVNASYSNGGGGVNQTPAAPKPKAEPTDAEASDARIARYKQQVESVARENFPWASQGRERAAWVAKQMEGVIEREGDVDLQNTKNEGSTALEREQLKQGGANKRAQMKWDNESAKLSAQDQQKRDVEANKIVREEMRLHPDVTPEDIAKKWDMPLSVIQKHMRGGVSRGAPAPEPGGDNFDSDPGQSPPSAKEPRGVMGKAQNALTGGQPREGDTRPMTKNGQTMLYRYERGMWRKQGPQQ